MEKIKLDPSNTKNKNIEMKKCKTINSKKDPRKGKIEKSKVKKSNLNCIPSYFSISKIIRNEGIKHYKIKSLDSSSLPEVKKDDADDEKYALPSTSSAQAIQGPSCTETQADGEPLTVLGDLLGTVIPDKNIDEKIPVPANLNSHHLVALGVETTGLDMDCHIIQITCSNVNSEGADFNCYIKPEKQIDYWATEVNGMTFNSGILMQNGVEVKNPQRLKDGLEKLIGYLREKTILISHNTKQFQARRLVRNIIKTNLLEGFSGKVIGFCDSYILYTKLFPKWQKELESYKLHYLIKHFSKVFTIGNFENPLPGQENMTKIRNLARLLLFHRLADERVQKLYDHSMSLEFFENLLSFEDPVKKKYLTIHIAKKLASSGLKLEHLEIAHRRAGMNGVFELLFSRVTKNRDVFYKLQNYFDETNIS